MKVHSKIKDKRREQVKAFIEMRKQQGQVGKLEKEFQWLANVLCVSVETIRKDYYM